MKTLHFRKAIETDSSSIASIHNLNVRGQSISKHRGFLLAHTTEQQVVKNLESGVQYFVATSDRDEVLGFMAVSIPKVDNNFLNQVLWKDTSYRTKITRDNNLYIQTVAVQPTCIGQGIGQFIYKSLYEEFSTSFFTTFVVSKPIENLRSLLFHEKQGFLQVGTVSHEQFLDMTNYESIFLLRE